MSATWLILSKTRDSPITNPDRLPQLARTLNSKVFKLRGQVTLTAYSSEASDYIAHAVNELEVSAPTTCMVYRPSSSRASGVRMQVNVCMLRAVHAAGRACCVSSSIHNIFGVGHNTNTRTIRVHCTAVNPVTLFIVHTHHKFNGVNH
jgi:hypothetical protein